MFIQQAFHSLVDKTPGWQSKVSAVRIHQLPGSSKLLRHLATNPKTGAEKLQLQNEGTVTKYLVIPGNF